MTMKVSCWTAVLLVVLAMTMTTVRASDPAADLQKLNSLVQAAKEEDPSLPLKAVAEVGQALASNAKSPTKKTLQEEEGILADLMAQKESGDMSGEALEKVNVEIELATKRIAALKAKAKADDTKTDKVAKGEAEPEPEPEHAEESTQESSTSEESSEASTEESTEESSEESSTAEESTEESSEESSAVASIVRVIKANIDNIAQHNNDLAAIDEPDRKSLVSNMDKLKEQFENFAGADTCQENPCAKDEQVVETCEAEDKCASKDVESKSTTSTCEPCQEKRDACHAACPAQAEAKQACHSECHVQHETCHSTCPSQVVAEVKTDVVRTDAVSPVATVTAEASSCTPKSSCSGQTLTPQTVPKGSLTDQKVAALFL